MSEIGSSEGVLSQAQYKPLRIWIPLICLPLMFVVRLVPSIWTDGPSNVWMFRAFGPLLIGFVILGWWLLLSGARGIERVIGIVGLIAILVAEQALAHFSMRGPTFMVITIPMTIAGFAVALVLLSKKLSFARTGVALLFAAVAASYSLLLRTEGVWGNFEFHVASRWSESAEERLLADAAKREKDGAIASDFNLESDWPRFRGPNQDSIQHGSRIDADWSGKPPIEIWRIKVGPAWSSFVTAGKYLITQEQRGDNETVVCYESDNGTQVWEQSRPCRFFEGLGGLGPRSTPTYDSGYIYALGAEGALVKLDVHDGHVLWTADTKQLSGRDAPPMWGFSASPLVHQGKVIVHTGGSKDKGILALSCDDGKLVWSAEASEQSYGSVQTIQLFNKTYLSLLSDSGAQLWDSDGKEMLNYEWKHNGYRALQPQVVDGNKLLIASGMGTGTRLISIQEQDGKLDATEVWTSRDLKPDFNDVLVHKGYIYGFDNRIFTCIDLATGKRKWKGGHYEKGQALMCGDSDLIIVVSEKGTLYLVRATPDKHEELAKIESLTGKTWNHPILVRNRLYLRNAEEAVAYELTLARE